MNEAAARNAESGASTGPTVEEKLLELYDKFYQSTTPEIRSQLDGMDSEYYIGFSEEVSGDGVTTYNFDENRLEMLINPNAESVIGTMGDEITHGIQYKTGKIMHWQTTTGANQRAVKPYTNQGNEIESKLGNINAVNNYNRHFGTSLPLSRSAQKFSESYPNNLAGYWNSVGYSFENSMEHRFV